MEPLRIGIVGVGFGIKGYLPALRAHPRFEVVAFASPHNAGAMAAKQGVDKSFSSCEEMVAGCELDAVAVVSPPFAHADGVLPALRAGKHVLCEEPFGIGLADAQAMVDAARTAGTACGVPCDMRFMPQSRALKHIVTSGALDPVREIEITALRSTLRRSEAKHRGWWFDREKGGGISGAVLSHLIDYANWLAGRSPVRSTGLTRVANASRHDDEGEFACTSDDGAFAVIDYGDGLVARLAADASSGVESYTCSIYGEDRGALVAGPNIEDLTLYRLEHETSEEVDCAPSRYAKYAFNTNIPPLMEILDEFVKRIEGQPNELPTFEEAFETQKVLAAIGYGT